MPEDALSMTEETDAGILLLSSARPPVGLDAGIELPLELPLELPGANRSAGRDPLILWQSPRDWLFLTSAAQRGDLLQSLRDAVTGQTALVNDMSDARVLFRITGRFARHVIAAGCGLNLPTNLPGDDAPGWCARTRFANLAVTLFARPEPHSFGLILERPHAATMRRWFAEAHHEFSTP